MSKHHIEFAKITSHKAAITKILQCKNKIPIIVKSLEDELDLLSTYIISKSIIDGIFRRPSRMG